MGRLAKEPPPRQFVQAHQAGAHQAGFGAAVSEAAGTALWTASYPFVYHIGYLASVL
jgi:hypothetical protein